MPERAYLSIGEVLSLLRPEFADLTISKIRFLESQGLLDPERTPSGYRKFYEPDVERLRWILRQQREQYLPLKVIKGRLGVELGPDDEDDEPVAAVAGEARAPRPAPARPAPHDMADVIEAEVEPAVVAPVSSVSPVADMENPLQPGRGGASVTLKELAEASGLGHDDLLELQRFGLIKGKTAGGTTFFDDEAVMVAALAAGFMRLGVEVRHLRMYKTAAEREASFFEQLVMPMLKQRNPRARRQAIDTLVELGKLGQALRASMLRMALKDHTGN